MLFLPPRHSKSMTVTETFPSYFIGKLPSRRVIEVSYGDRLARKFGRANRDKIGDFGQELFNIRLSDTQYGSTDWGLLGHRGGMLSAGIGGSITGEGADLLVIDDPIKNKQEAESEAYREMLWNEWKNTLATRLQADGAVIGILTRWHEDDWAGRVLKEEPDKWTVVSLPAIAELNDALGRLEGETLWPEGGFNAGWAKETKKTVGSKTWESLYQQKPSLVKGLLFKREWWQYFRLAPKRYYRKVQSWDTAFKKGQDNDYSVGGTWIETNHGHFLKQVWRDKLQYPDLKRQIISLYDKEKPRPDYVLVEDKASGQSLLQELQRTTTLPLVGYMPDADKVVRANTASPMVESGNVYLMEGAEWVSDYIDEMAAFPSAAHDDQVDMTTQYLNWAADNPRPMIFDLTER